MPMEKISHAISKIVLSVVFYFEDSGGGTTARRSKKHFYTLTKNVKLYLNGLQKLYDLIIFISKQKHVFQELIKIGIRNLHVGLHKIKAGI